MGYVKRVEGNYNPHRIENEVKKFWLENKVYEKIKELQRNRPKFYFLDGPPYVSAPTFHIGTARNKCIKDAVIRFMRMMGYDVWDRPGYDCHGLPIEIDVEKTLGIRRKKDIETQVGLEKFIEMCRNVAESNAKSMTELFKDLGIFMDWMQPYMTLRNEYIEAAWWLIKKAHDQGLLTQELRVLHWCPRCETVLADYEVSEYKMIEDPSIYVKFRVENSDNTYILIWTTTPWTLPANTFVMARSDADYVKVKVGNEYYILAEARVEYVMNEAGIKDYEIVERFKGLDIAGMRYIHPLEDIVPAQRILRKYHQVILADEFVTLTEGTGLVHAAPGHGEEDQQVALKHGIPIISLVDEQGRMVSDSGKYAGIYVREANDVIIDDLKSKGSLFFAGKVTHRYPVCWRCKTPLIFRATRQWIIKMSHMSKKALKEAQRVKWVPTWTIDRMRPLLEDMRDWVISRQRYWGTPLPIWICSKCGYTHVIGSKYELLKLGARIIPKDLHRPWVDIELSCPKCKGAMRRVPDVVDVWFDSGISFFASLAPEPLKKWNKLKPVDFIVEGHDQTRGWFLSLLRAGLLGFNEVPYASVLLHGFMLDEYGREMHKSLGNVVETRDVITKYGRDPLRFWLLQNTTWEDVRFSPRALEQARRDLNIVWNVFVFATSYMALDKFNPEMYTVDKVEKYLRPEDRWILSRLALLVDRVTKAFKELRIHEAARLIKDFIIEDVSHWYIRLIRRRVWEEAENPDKLAAYATLYYVLKTWLTLAAPIIPFISEYLYQRLVLPAEAKAPISIHMTEWVKPISKFIDHELERSMDLVKEIFETSAAIRMRHGIKLRQPLPELIIVTSMDSIRKSVKILENLVKELVNVGKIHILNPEEGSKYKVLEAKPILSILGKEFRSLTPKIVKYIEQNSRSIAEVLRSKGLIELNIANRTIMLKSHHVSINENYASGYDGTKTSWGEIILNLTVSELELAKGLARDIVRRIQVMRKELGLELDAKIMVEISTSTEKEAELLKKELKYIAQEVRASSIDVKVLGKIKGRLIKEWDIEGSKFIIAISPIT